MVKVTSDLCNAAHFTTISNILLNKSSLVVKNERFRLCEIEFYLKNDDHNDLYVHSIPDQKTFEGFYFHQFKNGSYKSGTYKGLDMTFGNVNSYFGILIRSMMNVNTGEFIEGPCRCVNKILELFGVDDVKAFMTNGKFNTQLKLYTVENGLYLAEQEHKSEAVFHGIRVGLSDKYPEFLNKNYRHAIFVKKIKKQKKFTEIKN